MNRLNKRSRFASRRRMADDDITIDELEEQLSEELDMEDVEQPKVDPEVASVIAEADEILKECEEDEERLPDSKPIVSEEEGVLKECDDLEKKIARIRRKASESKPGVEDKIGDEAHGGDPSVSTLPDTKVKCETDKQVFGQNTDSAYVARITRKLDRVASALERRGMKRMAFRIDQLSDRLEASVRK